jgi:hypothetical protein
MPKPDKPIVFISCGQFTEDEIDLGKEIAQAIRETTDYDAYFAEAQKTLEGLSANILSALHKCAGFIAVAHHRGTVTRPTGDVVRASVWIEQEIAIAAFIQHALKRQIEVAIYLQKGIKREGPREQLRLAPIEFETSAEVLSDVRQRVSAWRLDAPGTNRPPFRVEISGGKWGSDGKISVAVKFWNYSPTVAISFDTFVLESWSKTAPHNRTSCQVANAQPAHLGPSTDSKIQMAGRLPKPPVGAMVVLRGMVHSYEGSDAPFETDPITWD